MNITKMLNKYGRSVYLSGSDGWESPVFRAFIQPLRYKTKLYLQGEHTPIGINKNDVYLYIGPATHDLTKLNESHRIHDRDNNKYMIDRAERIMVKDTIVYIWAVIRKTTEGDL
ncbi:MAG: hypothetical protein IJZ16_08075 [Clostridia bacterium]|nr:hypothetical protein [Clostridia bacterium]